MTVVAVAEAEEGMAAQEAADPGLAVTEVNAESEAAAEQKQVEIQDDSLAQPSHIDKSRVGKPGVQDVTMRKALSAANGQDTVLPEVGPTKVKETSMEEVPPAPQGNTTSDVSAEASETAAKSIEQASKRVSNSVRLVGSELKVFISHCKRTPGTEDRAVWIADVLDSSEVGVKAWFDRSDLSEITMDSLKQAVEEAAMLITILDPSTFDSEWVQAENAWALAAGLPILAFYDADRYRWDEVSQWRTEFPHVFTYRGMPLSMTSSVSCVLRIDRQTSQRVTS